MKCPPGTYSQVTGLTSMYACNVCHGGYYCDEYAMTEYKICPAGHFCPVSNATHPLTRTPCIVPEPCPIGTFLDVTGGTSLADCKTCPAGFVCHQTGTVQPTACPLGSYCPEGSSVSTPCPAGTFSLIVGAGVPEQRTQIFLKTSF